MFRNRSKNRASFDNSWRSQIVLLLNKKKVFSRQCVGDEQQIEVEYKRAHVRVDSHKSKRRFHKQLNWPSARVFVLNLDTARTNSLDGATVEEHDPLQLLVVKEVIEAPQ